MAAATFDTLKFANTLKSAGVPDKQAEAQAAAFAEVIQINFKELVTKEDLRRDIAELRTELKRDIAELRTELKHDIAETKSEIKRDIADIRGEMKVMRWMHGAILGLLVPILIRLFFFRGPV